MGLGPVAKVGQPALYDCGQDPDAVVGNLYLNRVIDGDADTGAGRPGVSDHIGQTFPDNGNQIGFELGGEAVKRSVDPQIRDETEGLRGRPHQFRDLLGAPESAWPDEVQKWSSECP